MIRFGYAALFATLVATASVPALAQTPAPQTQDQTTPPAAVQTTPQTGQSSKPTAPKKLHHRTHHRATATAKSDTSPSA